MRIAEFTYFYRIAGPKIFTGADTWTAGKCETWTMQPNG
jgi:hypothetical protein